MTTRKKPRRSFWTWGLQTDEPTDAERADHASELSRRFGTEILAPPIPRAADLDFRPPRIEVPTPIAQICRTDNYERALHSYSADDREPAVPGSLRQPSRRGGPPSR